MPKGGIRPRKEDGSLNHLIKPKWKSGKTKTIRVPEVLAAQLLEIARKLDNSDLFDLSQDSKVEIDQTKEPLFKARALLQNAIVPKSKGGSYAANNAAGVKKLVEQALELLTKPKYTLDDLLALDIEPAPEVDWGKPMGKETW